MPWVEFIWFERPLQKMEGHGVTREEVKQVVRSAPAAAIEQSRRSEHMTVKGPTRAGRMIRVVFDWADDACTTVVAVTAYASE